MTNKVEQKIPQVFISYSWTTPEHEEWVLDLARRLAAEHVYVHFDKWDLKEGHDKYQFMESMVNSDEIDKVLIICDSGYKRKADNREGGVGTETQIITPDLYGNTKQEKFIPVLAERDAQGKEIVPAFVSARMYIDLSSKDTFDDNFEQLVRNIYGVPVHKRPPLGQPPVFLLDETIHFPTTSVIRKLNFASEKDPKRLKYLWNEFSETFLESLEPLQINDVHDPNSLDDQVVDKIDSSVVLKTDFIRALELMCEFEILETEHIVEFFEKIYAFTEFQGPGTSYEIQFDHFKFLIHELFIDSIAVLLKNRRYDIVADLLYTEYHVSSRYNGKKRIYSDFRFHLPSLEMRNQRLGLKRLSVHSDILNKRIPVKYKEEFFTADLLLHYVDRIRKPEYWGWFPYTYIYLGESSTLKLFSKLKSRKHFQNTKMLYNVDTPNELQKLVQNINSTHGFSGGFRSIPSIKAFINPDEICTLP